MYERPLVTLKRDAAGTIGMARKVGPQGARTAAVIRDAGLTLIARHGYEAMSLRQLAAEVGLRPASLYNHFETKQDLLFDLVGDHLVDLLGRTDAALEAAGPRPLERLLAFVANHVLYHLDKKREVTIANLELRSLEPRNLDAAMALRRSYEDRLIAVLDAGAAAGAFAVGETRVVAYATLAMLTGACTWYRPGGRLSEADMVRIHTDLVLGGLGVAGTDAARTDAARTGTAETGAARPPGPDKPRLVARS